MKKKIFLNKYNLLKPGSIKLYQELLLNCQLSKIELERIHQQKLRNLITTAFENSPFYRDFYKAHLKDIQNSDFLQNHFHELPVLTKTHLKTFEQEIFAKGWGASNCNRITTGGSTGEPTTVWHPKPLARAAALWRMAEWWGCKPGCDIATAYRESATSMKSTLKNNIISWPSRKIFLDASHISNHEIVDWLRRCSRHCPPILHGYVGAIEHIADYVIENKIDTWKPKAIWVTSAPVSSVQKEKISRAFSAPVYDQYGSCEVFYLACETPFAEGLAVFHDLRKIEIVDKNYQPVPHGTEGKILVTDLENAAFPIIRYELGDRGSFLANQKDWQLPFPRINPVKGRVSDILDFPNGISVSGEYWTTIFDKYPEAVSRFQIIQNKDKSLTLNYVQGTDKNSDKQISAVTRDILETVENSVCLNVKKMKKIESDRGKTRFIVKK